MKPAKCLLIGSTEAYSGKSATIIGTIHQLQEQGITVSYGKPVATCITDRSTEIVDKDVRFLADIFDWEPDRARSPLLYLDGETIGKRLKGQDLHNYKQVLQEYIAGVKADLILLEGPNNLWEGSLFDLSLGQIAELLDSSILLVARYHSVLLADSILAAKQYLGNRLLGIVLNDVPPNCLESARSALAPFLEERGIPIFGILPRNNLLRSISVRELAKRLSAKILCRADRLDLMVETLTIGAMNVNSALGYFRQRKNMAVVTGGDRTDLQLAALETSTQCLILTGQIAPQSLILSRAEDLEIPILSVDLDTLSTVEIIEEAFGTVPIQEPIKIKSIQELMKEHFNLNRLIQTLDLEIS